MIFIFDEFRPLLPQVPKKKAQKSVGKKVQKSIGKRKKAQRDEGKGKVPLTRTWETPNPDQMETLPFEPTDGLFTDSQVPDSQPDEQAPADSQPPPDDSQPGDRPTHFVNDDGTKVSAAGNGDDDGLGGEQGKEGAEEEAATDDEIVEPHPMEIVPHDQPDTMVPDSQPAPASPQVLAINSDDDQQGPAGKEAASSSAGGQKDNGINIF